MIQKKSDLSFFFWGGVENRDFFPNIFRNYSDGEAFSGEDRFSSVKWKGSCSYVKIWFLFLMVELVHSIALKSFIFKKKKTLSSHKNKLVQSHGILGPNFHLSFIQCHLCVKPCVRQDGQENF